MSIWDLGDVNQTQAERNVPKRGDWEEVVGAFKSLLNTRSLSECSRVMHEILFSCMEVRQ